MGRKSIFADFRECVPVVVRDGKGDGTDRQEAARKERHDTLPRTNHFSICTTPQHNEFAMHPLTYPSIHMCQNSQYSKIEVVVWVWVLVAVVLVAGAGRSGFAYASTRKHDIYDIYLFSS